MALEISKRQLYLLSNVTLFGFGGIGLIIVHFSGEQTVRDMIFSGLEIHYQTLIGLIYGVVTALLGLAMVSRPKMDEVTSVFYDMFAKLDLGIEDIIFYSFCAGFGEELLFRAGIQPWIGLWPTAIIFVAIHGYLNPTNWKIFLYGFFLVFVSAGLGYLYAQVGFFSAAIAHMLFDVVMFLYLIKKKNPTSKNPSV